MNIEKLGFKKHMPRSQTSQTHDENTCQTPPVIVNILKANRLNRNGSKKSNRTGSN